MAHIKHESSSQIFSTAYEPVDQLLTVRFKCGSCKGSGGNCADCPRCDGRGWTKPEYRYKDVPADKYGAVRDADSVGSAFHTHIKKGGYAFEKVG